MRFLVIIMLLIVLVATVGITYAQSTGSQVYSVAVNKAGAMRLLQADGNGSYANKPRSDETVIDIPSASWYQCWSPESTDMS